MILKCNCTYCNEHDWMFRIPGTNKVYLEIPKNASSTIHQYYNINRKNGIRENDLRGDETGFLVLRDPIERFKSLVAHYFIEGGRVAKGQEWRRQHKLTGNTVDAVLEHFDKLNTISEPHHWAPQSSFINTTFLELSNTEIWNTDMLREKMGVVNKSASDKVLLIQEQIDVVKEIYEDDFRLYNQFFK